MTTGAQRAAQQEAAQFKFKVQEHRRDVAARPVPPGTVGVCRADGWDVSTEHLNGDFDLDTPVGQELLRRLIAQQPSVLDSLRTWDSVAAVPSMTAPSRPAPARPGPRPENDLPPWLHDYLFGQWGGNGLGSETRAATVGPGNVVGNALGAAQTAAYLGMQGQTASRLAAGAQQIASGAARTIRINSFIELYNANQGKGRPRLRLRIRGLPVTVATPIAGFASWRSNAKGTVHSTRWANPTGQQMRSAGVVAAETRWTRSMGWATGKVGTGLVTFAPTAALDAWNSVEFDIDAAGQRRFRSFDTHKFLISSARNQSGNAAGLAASVASVPLAVAIAGWAGLSIVGAPLVLIGLAAGIAVQVLWNQHGGADFAEREARNVLGAKP
ncbi:hypothetical protein OOT46_24170 [Aquabacterium sp. A7-Y]|uniref:hypothetical protein n=1 Tax=Aquabacterium sp. A7-Y TaxID=1349605 RepID=UPI00223CFFAB|nr:hypothetical protein [Aquabacterium sp. A7-Y]MCW7540922.1 hypothetical protein [Aquabacterium sp. A7-Y]